MRLALFCLTLGALSFQAVAADRDWRWIGGQTTTHKWDVNEGLAELTISDGKLSAKLYAKDSDRLVQSLRGSIKGKAVSVRRKDEQGDVGSEPMRGTYARGSSGYWYTFESIILLNEWGFLGLTRTVDRPKKPNPTLEGDAKVPPK